MPYTLDNPPDAVKNLPKGAQKLFIEAFNSVAESGGSEEEARKAGWANVKRKYKKKGGKWVQKADEINDLWENLAALWNWIEELNERLTRLESNGSKS